MRKAAFLLAVIIALAISASPTGRGARAADDKTGHDGHKAAHWGYFGAEGPAGWAGLHADYATCGAGERQSPVNVPSNAPHTIADLAFDYRPTRLNLVNNGHTIQVNLDPGSVLSINGKAYEVAQFHFHAPSENVVDGVASALEMHIVHVAADGTLAVVGVLFDIGEADNEFLSGFWSALPEAGAEAPLDSTTEVTAAFDTDAGITSFAGSLTTPPCSEGVRWFLVKSRETLSRGQLAAFVNRVGLNARPVQPLNGRVFGGL